MKRIAILLAAATLASSAMNGQVFFGISAGSNGVNVNLGAGFPGVYVPVAPAYYYEVDDDYYRPHRHHHHSKKYYKKMRKRYKKYMKHHAPRIYTAHTRRTYQIVAPPPVRGHKHGWHKHHHDWDDD